MISSHCEQKAVVATPILEVKSETNLNRSQVSIPSILQLEEVSSTNKCNKQEQNGIHKSLAKMKNNYVLILLNTYLKSETGLWKKMIWPWLTCQNIFHGLKSFLEKQR